MCDHCTHDHLSIVDQCSFIKEEFSEYLRSTFDIRDQTYRNLFFDHLEEMKSDLYKGPYLKATLPFAPGKSIQEMIDEGAIHLDFLRLGGIPEIKDRPLYLHQEKAIRKIESGRSVVITTGTGSGKTECFLFPILDSIIKEMAAGDTTLGVRAIMLFPMNALINDQIDRIRDYLRGFPQIKFAFFTGETPQKAPKKQEGEPAPTNELTSREEIRKTPPHILFTNFSMLEYLLIRPEDKSVISADSLKKLKYFIMDEAHTYKGTLAIEISYLLKRVMGMARHPAQFILTSATLGDGKNDLQNIVNFAKSLTGAAFAQDDIIFSETTPLPVLGQYIHIEPKDILEMLEHEEDYGELIKLVSKYGITVPADFTPSNIVYSALSQDMLVRELYALCRNPIEFRIVLAAIRSKDHAYTEKSLNALIQLISFANSPGKWGRKLFDIKYHMFVKAPDACFITLGKDPQLSLVNCTTINGKKAFKIGICQNCKTPFIMGRSDNDDHVLMTDDEIDIDETYAVKQTKLEYYLISSLLTPYEKDNVLNAKGTTDEYIVCSKCGKIRRKDGTDSIEPCSCGTHHEVELIRYQEKQRKGVDDEELNANNIGECPVCEYSASGSGVVLGFHVGKDRATALLAQMLYQSLPQKTETIISEDISSFFGKPNPVVRKEPKQFLAFSDGRQQAAFFSKFVNENNDRFLKKAIVWKILQDNGHKPIPVKNLKDEVEQVFKGLGYSDDGASKQAWSTVLWELLLVDGRNSAEGLGLYYYDVSLPPAFYCDQDIETSLKTKGFTISATAFRTIVRQIIKLFRTVPAIEYDSFCGPSEREDLLGYRSFKNYVALQKAPAKKSSSSAPSEDTNTRSLLPVKENQSNKILDYIMKTCALTLKQAKDLVGLIWKIISDPSSPGRILVKKAADTKSEKAQMSYRVQAASFVLHSCKEPGAHFYQCGKCGNTTVLNLDNKCAEGDCTGSLVEVDPEKVFATNYYRKQYVEKPIEIVNCEEHTAQIHGQEGKKRQIRFKQKKTNILSWSTTFEMGVDLGSLTTVFMRNVPPTPANYAQRAGRAGRRSDTPAFILTFCSSSSHDYTFFSDPPRMISGIVEVPSFNINNEKIVLRHLIASSLGFFFREEKKCDSFPTIEEFIEDEGFDGFEDYLKSKPTSLGAYIDTYVLQDPALSAQFGNWKWLDYIDVSSSAMKDMVNYLKDAIRDLEDGIQNAIAEHQFNVANEYQSALNKLKEGNSLVTYMSRHGVIPGYGFPVDNVDLKIFNLDEQVYDDRYSLNRNLGVAISEYAPDSEVIVDNKKYTSHYIRLPYDGSSLVKQYYVKCTCGSVVVSSTKMQSGEICPCCQKSLDPVLQNQSTFIRPDRGFVATWQNKQTRRMKPARTYASEIYYVGQGTSSEPAKTINGTLTLQPFHNERLLVLNESNFYYCTKCGFAMLKKGLPFPTISHKHAGLQGSCTNEELELAHLGYCYMTDVMKITVDKRIDFRDRDTALSVLYALLEGTSIAFEIDRDDIEGIIFRTTEHENYQLIFFDRTSGGAEYVKSLADPDKLQKALREAFLKVKHQCCDETTSCYNCLRNYKNQNIHKHLKRGLARDKLQEIIDSIALKKETFAVEGPQYALGGDNLSVLRDCLDDDETPAFDKLVEEANSVAINKPSGWGFAAKSEQTGKKFDVDFFWPEFGLMLFGKNHLASYIYLDKQSTYDCYLMDDSFDASKIVSIIKK